ncbi:MAG TPA: hypothetical protein VLT47_14015 [Anaeromyxobacteraceae bacterium]|nr:hypothetical protein [Anaeromyxobacteraceae bacterium]
MVTTCYRCGARLDFDGPIGRRTSCPECDFDLHACINCRHYDESAARSCREPHAEMIVDKESSNACDLFQLGDGASHRRGSGKAAKDALHALFGQAPAREEDPRDALEALFRKK